MNIQSLLCRVGLHRWKEDYSQRKPFKSLRVHVFLFSWAIQKSVETCSCCGVSRKVYRDGWYGLYTDDSKVPWLPMSEETENYIDSLGPL